MTDHLLEPSQRDDSNKWSNIGFSEEIGILEKNTLFIWNPDKICAPDGRGYFKTSFYNF